MAVGTVESEDVGREETKLELALIVSFLSFLSSVDASFLQGSGGAATGTVSRPSSMFPLVS